MTEKELLYAEDTISHLNQMEQICTSLVEELNNKELIKIIEKIIKKSSSSHDDLINLLKNKEEGKDE